MFTMFTGSMSGFPNKAEPFPRTTNDLHLSYLFLGLICTLHTASWVMLVLLYVLNIMFLS